MTDSSIIQDARDVLAKWREGAHFDALHIANDAPAHPEQWGAWTEPGRGGWSPVGPMTGSGSLALIVGTAGNPELLDAIDGVLAAAIESLELLILPDEWPDFIEFHNGQHAVALAAAIVAANERMSA